MRMDETMQHAALWRILEEAARRLGAAQAERAIDGLSREDVELPDAEELSALMEGDLEWVDLLDAATEADDSVYQALDRAYCDGARDWRQEQLDSGADHAARDRDIARGLR